MVCWALCENKGFRTPGFLCIEGAMANLLLRDLAVVNVVGLGLTAILFLAGWSLINALSISLLMICAILLIFGSALGFFLTSSSFDALLERFGKRERGEEESEVEKRRPKVQTRAELRSEQIDFGKRMIFVGLILLGESLLISLSYMAL